MSCTVRLGGGNTFAHQLDVKSRLRGGSHRAGLGGTLPRTVQDATLFEVACIHPETGKRDVRGRHLVCTLAQWQFFFALSGGSIQILQLHDMFVSGSKRAMSVSSGCVYESTYQHPIE